MQQDDFPEPRRKISINRDRRRLPAALLLAWIWGLSAPVAAQENATCRADHTARCAEHYQGESRQCDRYYLQRTEANRLCHDSARQRQAICEQRAAQACAPDEPAGSRQP